MQSGMTVEPFSGTVHLAVILYFLYIIGAVVLIPMLDFFA